MIEQPQVPIGQYGQKVKDVAGRALLSDKIPGADT